MRAGVLLVLVVLAVSTAAVAHEPAPPPSWMTRLLQDCNDDYFGSDALGSRPGHDIHALDVRDAWDGARNVLVFRVIANGDGDGVFRLEVTGANTKTFSWTTTDTESWTGTGFASISGPHPARKVDGTVDGDRFYLEGTVPYTTLGLAVGDTIRAYSVTGSADGSTRDRLPGYDGDVLGECTDNYQRPSYKTLGPDGSGSSAKYVTVALDATARLVADTEAFIDIDLANMAPDAAQQVTLRVDAPAGIVARFHDSQGGYNAEPTIALAKKGTSGATNLVHLALRAEAGASGTVTVTYDTDLGGHGTRTIQVSTADAAPTTSTPPPSNDTPVPAWLPIGALMAAWCLRRRA